MYPNRKFRVLFGKCIIYIYFVEGVKNILYIITIPVNLWGNEAKFHLRNRTSSG